ncbi:MAG: hypothetical protein IPM42_17090 [Saprospiraceae bacterium]|nr:hypothetical protein [Saprospiraceae bacterium]
MIFSNSYGQFNIKVGYRGGFSKMEGINNVLDRFNEKYFTLEDKFDHVRSLHGLELGLRYRIGSVAAEVSWCNQSSKTDALGRLPSGSSFQDKWFYSLTEWSMGLENYIGDYFGYGASIGYSTLNIKTDIEGSRRKKRLAASDNAYNTKFYIFYQYPGEKVAIAFKPYIQFPLRPYNISAFDQDLNVAIDPSYIAVPGQQEKLMIFGLSILLYNGRQ